MKYSVYIFFLFIPALLFYFEAIAQIYKQPAEITADSLLAREHYSEALSIYEHLLPEGEKQKGILSKARIKCKIGNCLNHLGREQEALKYYYEIIDNQEKFNDPVLISDAFTGLGVSYEYTGKLDSAFSSYHEAYSRVANSSDTMRIARGVRNIAQVLRVMNRFEEAQNYCRKAMELIPGINDYRVVANIYNETAYLFELADLLDSARHYYNKLIEISIENKFQKGESVGLTNLASVYERENNYEKALGLKLRALEMDKKLDDTYGMMTSYRSLKDSYMKMKRYQEAFGVLNASRELCDTSWIFDLSGIYLGYYEVYKAIGDFEKALIFHEMHDQLRNRVINEETQKQISEILTKYETEQKEQKIQLLEKSNQLKINKIRLQWVLLGGVLILFLATLIAVKLLVTAKDRRLLKMESEIRSLQLRKIREERAHPDASENIDPEVMYQELGLTSRESGILFYLGQGCSNSQIAEKLFVSENTVKFHMKNIYIKLDVKNRVQALMRCNETNHTTSA